VQRRWLGVTVAERSVLATTVGGLRLRSAVMTASGTSGHGAELAAYGCLAELGAVVVKSLAAQPWPGNDGMRLHGAAGGSMLNRVGLQGPGVAAWRARDLPALLARGATVVASIWGRTAAEFGAAAEALVVEEGNARAAAGSEAVADGAGGAAGVGAAGGAAGAGGAAVIAPGIAAVEVNVSCPNLSGHVFAHSPQATAEAVASAVAVLGRSGVPVWAKLSPAVPDICAIASAALEAGASGLTLVNTMPAMWIDVDDGRAPFAGGLSGPALHPIAVRAVHDCRRAFPDVPIVGVGGIASGADAVELLMAGANAVQVGTATFAEPRAPWRVQEELARWCTRRGTTAEELSGAALG
jgi:dihydroorotate dehydrogenase (NAD+) catalytic subunit